MSVPRPPRTIRLVGAVAPVFERAAEPGKRAVAGCFALPATGPATLRGSARRAFAGGHPAIAQPRRLTFAGDVRERSRLIGGGEATLRPDREMLPGGAEPERQG